MKVAILTMFNGLSSVYSLVNVVREQLEMLLHDGISVKMLVSEHCPDSERTGVFADARIEWIKIVNSKDGQFFKWHTYTKSADKIHDTFFEEAALIAADFAASCAVPAKAALALVWKTIRSLPLNAFANSACICSAVIFPCSR
ncbi:MAG: hypothetical protein RSD54_03360, partial [Ruthenibacterium sp.]